MNLFLLLVAYFVTLAGVIFLLNFFGLTGFFGTLFGFIGVTLLFMKLGKN
jgi:hypothetical protein